MRWLPNSNRLCTNGADAVLPAAIFTLLLLISIVPATLCHRSRDTIFPPPFYSLLAIPAALTSLLGFVFLITLSTIATARFHDAGLYAVYGSLVCASPVLLRHAYLIPPRIARKSNRRSCPCSNWEMDKLCGRAYQPWMSLAATVILLFLMFYTGCGATWRGPFGEMSPHIRNRWSAVYAY